MVDLANQEGPMCDWPEVQVVHGAVACLQRLSQHAQCHLATNAEDSTEAQIRLALDRAGLSEYISHVFCRENLGVGKTDPSYFSKIIDVLAVSPKHITMLGDSLERDVNQAKNAGINAIWYNPKQLSADEKSNENIEAISSLDFLV